jgi:GAF domain-containing protein
MVEAETGSLPGEAARTDILRFTKGKYLRSAVGAAADSLGALAGITLTDAVGPWTVAASHELAARLDGLQYMLREGPYFAAVSTGRIVVCDDLVTDPGWPEFTPRATDNGITAALSVPFGEPDNPGVLNLYCQQPSRLRADAERLATALAAQLAVVVTLARHSANLAVALESRDLIGQAKGIIMERHKVDAERAFAVLARLSQERNTKLREVAGEIVRTGETGDLR